MKLLLILLLSSSALFAEDKPKPAESPSTTKAEQMELRALDAETLNIDLEMQALQLRANTLMAKRPELVKQKSEVISAICKRAGIEGCEIRPDGVIVKRPEAKPIPTP